MAYKWRPSQSQKRAFAEKMQNPEFEAQYNARAEQRAEKRRETSAFDYATAGGKYVPTAAQYEVAMEMLAQRIEETAANEVITGYICQMAVHHDYIHIVNVYRRSNA